jgi:thioredoxin reductase
MGSAGERAGDHKGHNVLYGGKGVHAWALRHGAYSNKETAIINRKDKVTFEKNFLNDIKFLLLLRVIESINFIGTNKKKRFS